MNSQHKRSKTAPGKRNLKATIRQRIRCLPWRFRSTQSHGDTPARPIMIRPPCIRDNAQEGDAQNKLKTGPMTQF